VLAQRTMQSDAVLVTEHAEVELLVDSVEECVVVCWLFVGLLSRARSAMVGCPWVYCQEAGF
jgi:hypothetical protein